MTHVLRTGINPLHSHSSQTVLFYFSAFGGWKRQKLIKTLAGKKNLTAKTPVLGFFLFCVCQLSVSHLMSLTSPMCPFALRRSVACCFA